MKFIKLKVIRPTGGESVVYFNTQHVVMVAARLGGTTCVITSEADGSAMVNESVTEVMALIEKAEKS